MSIKEEEIKNTLEFVNMVYGWSLRIYIVDKRHIVAARERLNFISFPRPFMAIFLQVFQGILKMKITGT